MVKPKIHRHHKRTPYAANAFPVEPSPWDCDDQQLFSYAQPATGPPAAPLFRAVASSIPEPFALGGLTGTCRFPQITVDGLADSHVHGADLHAVYHGLLGLLPARGDENSWRAVARFRATNNEITSQVAGALIAGLRGAPVAGVPLAVQPVGADSLEPQYACPAAAAVWAAIKASRPWRRHLAAARELFAALDAVSGVAPADEGFHMSLDHYFDNLSARQCHGRPLPCRPGGGRCATQDLADAVYRVGQWEYSFLYRGHDRSLAASVGAWGLWVAELAAHLRAVVDGRADGVVWRHNIAHDGSVSRLLSILQADVMVWPGMGGEVVFELWRDRGAAASGEKGVDTATRSPSGLYVRVLFGGRVLKSSNPGLGRLEMLRVEALLAYFDGLVGRDAALMARKCNGSIPL